VTAAVVGVNLLWLVPGVVGGSEEYTVRLLRAFDRLDPEDLELKLYAQPALADAYPDLTNRFETVLAPRILSNRVARPGADATWLVRACRRDDLIHHAGSVAPATSPRPYVLTVHDVQPLDIPENFSFVKRHWMLRMMPPSIRNATLVLCPSHFAANSIVRHVDWSVDRVRVVPHGHDPVEAGVAHADVAADLHRRFGRYLLLPAIAYAHKRHVDLIDALARLADDFPDLSVVFTGGPGPETEALGRHASSLGLADRVHRLGRVSEAELDDLYRSATALVFPSTYEGFGNPTLEAMARGCPVIASDAASIPEVVEDAGLLVEPRSPEAIEAAVRRLLSEPDLEARLRAAGPERAEAFGWKAAGRALIGAYRDALAIEERS
jgi:alpha-1,3-rhamnosyl/mannosyltransferase